MRPDRLARLHRAIDRQTAEAVVVVPFAGGGYLVGGPDPNRPVVEIQAVVMEVPKTVREVGSGANSGHNAELRTATHTVKFSTADVPFAIDRGDRIVLLERDTVDAMPAELQADSALPFGTARTILMLKKLA